MNKTFREIERERARRVVEKMLALNKRNNRYAEGVTLGVVLALVAVATFAAGVYVGALIALLL